MKKRIFWLVGLFIFISGLNVEGGILDNLRKALDSKEKGKAEELVQPKSKPQSPRRGDNSIEEKARLQEQEVKELSPEFDKVVIKPFGNLEWEDSLWTVIEKLNDIEGVEKIDFSPQMRKQKSWNLKGINKKEFFAILEEYTDDLIGGRGPYRFQNKGKGQDERMKIYLSTKGSQAMYKDIQGNGKIPEKVPDILVSPIIIKGVPFKMGLHFLIVPGIAIAKPDDLLIVKNVITFPLVLHEVSLGSNSPILKDRFKEINAVFEEKYGKFDPWSKRREQPRLPAELRYLNNTDLYLTVTDRKGYKLMVNGGPRGYSIAYTTSEKYLRELGEVYRKHLAGLEAQKVGDKKDMSQGL